MASLGDIVIGLRMDATPFSANAQRARGSIAAIASSARSAAVDLLSLLGTGSAVAALGWGVKLAADAEQAQISFEVMLGSGKAAQQMLAALRQYSDKSPFDSIVPREVAQTLLNFGVSADRVLPIIRMLGDVAAGDGAKLKGLGLVFGQMSATGRLMGQDLLQFINAGFNPLQQIAQRTGESMGQLKARMEAGGISAREVEQAFKDATSEGGRFFGMTDRQSSSLAGMWSTTKDTIVSTLTDIGAKIAEVFDLKGVLSSAIYWLGLISELTKTYGGDVLVLVKIIASMVAAVAILRGALWAYSTIQSLLIAKELVLKALMGPAGWATIAAAVVGAAVAFGQLDSQFDSIAKKARTAATEIEAVANAGKKGQGKAAEDPVTKLIALQQELRRMQNVGREFGPNVQRVVGVAAEKVVSAADIRQLIGIKQTGDSAEQATPKVKLLRDTLAMLNDMRGLIPAGEIRSLQNDIQEALRKEQDERIGLAKAIEKEREELQKLQAEMNPNADIDRFRDQKGSEEGLAKLTAIRQQNAELLKQKETREELARTQKQEQDELQARADRLKESTMSDLQKRQKELRDIEELFIKGLIDEDTRNKAIANVDKDKGGGTSQASKAVLAGSSEAASTILRGAFGSKSLESMTAENLKVQKKLLEIAEAKAKNGGEFPIYEIKEVNF